jgi:nitroreductase
MDFYEVITTRRSIRKYSSKPISDEVLNRVLDAVRIAPSGSNRQPWKFIIVKDKQVKDTLALNCNKQQFIADAPLAIVACGYDVQYNRGGYMGAMTMIMDVSIAFTHLILAARAEGLGTCWIGAFDNKALKQLLKLPDEWNVVAVTPLGYPNEPFAEPKSRKPIPEITSVDQF